jgi:hypothetical protein
MERGRLDVDVCGHVDRVRVQASLVREVGRGNRFSRIPNGKPPPSTFNYAWDIARASQPLLKPNPLSVAQPHGPPLTKVDGRTVRRPRMREAQKTSAIST